MPQITAIIELIGQLRAELAAQGQEGGLRPGEAPEPVAREAVQALAERYRLPATYQAVLLTLGQQGFSIAPGPFQQIIVPAAPGLEAAQVGYRGARPGDDSFVVPHGWRKRWVVIATDAADPYFLDTTRATPDGECPVYTAEQGTGSWEPRLAASSIAQFLRILRAWLKIVAPHQDRQNPAEPLDDAHARRLRAEITAIDPDAADHWSV